MEKYRAKNKFGNWVYGIPYQNANGNWVLQGWSNGNLGLKTKSLYEIDKDTIRKFSGIIDELNYDIYEGDVFADVLSSGLNGVVKFGVYHNCFDKPGVKKYGGHVGFYVQFSDDRVRKDLIYWARNSAKIGNIIDSPELI